MTLTVPLPAEEMKIQPSLERVNVNDWFDFETEDTSSASETKLFRFLSPEKRIAASPTAVHPQITIKTEASCLEFIIKAHRDASTAPPPQRSHLPPTDR